MNSESDRLGTEAHRGEKEEKRQGIAKQLRESYLDIAVVEGHGDDVFVKVYDDVLLLDEHAARTTAKEILSTLDGEEIDPAVNIDRTEDGEADE